MHNKNGFNNEKLLEKSKDAQEILKNYFKGHEDDLNSKGLCWDFQFLMDKSQILPLDTLIKKYYNEWIRALYWNKQYVYAMEIDFLDSNIKENVTNDFENDLSDNILEYGEYFYLEDISCKDNYYYLHIPSSIAQVNHYFSLKDDGEELWDGYIENPDKYLQLFLEDEKLVPLEDF